MRVEIRELESLQIGASDMAQTVVAVEPDLMEVAALDDGVAVLSAYDLRLVHAPHVVKLSKICKVGGTHAL